MVEQTARKVARLGLENVTCGQGDLRAPDFSDDSFDVAIAGNVLHLLDDPRRAVAELVRVTRSGGLIVVPNYLNAGEGNRRFLKLIEAAGFTAVHEWDEDGFLGFLSSCGLEVVESRRFDAKQPLCVAVCRSVD